MQEIIQTKINFKVYQGERKLAKENKFLGKLQINFPSKLRGQVISEVTFDLNIYGILNVKAKVLNSEETTDLYIIVDNLIEEAIIHEFIKKTEKMEEYDKKYLEKIK